MREFLIFHVFPESRDAGHSKRKQFNGEKIHDIKSLEFDSRKLTRYSTGEMV